MAGVVTDSIRTEFLSNCFQMTEQCYQESKMLLEENRRQILLKTVKEIKKTMEILVKQYEDKKASGEIGELKYVFFSFLRTGIVRTGTWYRVDYYDMRERISLVECGSKLELSEILSPWYESTYKLRKIFGKQTRVKEYELDYMLYQMAERYQPLVACLLEDAVRESLNERGRTWFGEERVEFWQGEYMDKARCFYCWE